MKRYVLMMCATICLFVISISSFAQSNQTVTSGSTTAPVTFPGPDCTYTWTNSDPSIGLPASGTGNIPAFTAKNTGVNTVTATITATPAAANGFAYITGGSTTGAVSVIDISTDKVVATIPVGQSPIGVAISADGTRVYVTNQGGGGSPSVSVINASTNKVIATISMPANSEPSGIVISPDGKTLYVGDYNTGSVSVISTATNTITGTITVGSYPWAMVMSADGSRIYVGNLGTTDISVISTASNTVIATIPINAAITGIALSPDDSKLYVGLYNTTTISIINTSNYTVMGTATVGNYPASATATPDGSRLYVSNGYANTISVINTADNSTIATIPTGFDVTMIDVSRDGSKVYAVVTGASNVLVISTKTNSIIATIPVEPGPISLGKFVGGCPAVTFKITVNSDPDATFPTITTTTATGNISACVGTASASPNIQQFTVSGSNLTDVITATAPPGFQISFSANGTYGSSVSLAEAAGVTFSTPLYIRSAATDPAGNISGNVVLSSPGATNQTVAVSGVVNALPTVNAVANQTVNAGASTTAINFTGTGNTFTWTNNTPSIGLPASGAGNIASFVATNTGSTPVTATITVTPVPTGFAYIANQASGTVSVVNATTLALVNTIPVGTNPFGVSVSPDGSTVYVTNRGSANMSVINAQTNAVTATVTVGSSPSGVVVSPDGTKVYVANFGSNTVSVISTATNNIISTITVGSSPYGVAVSPDGTKLYVTNYNSNSVSVVNTATNVVITTVPVSSNPTGIAVSPNGSHFFVSNTGANTVVDINASNYSVAGTTNVGGAPLGLVVSPDGSKVYVAVATGFLTIVFTTDHTFASTAEGNPQGISLSPDGSKIYYTDGRNGELVEKSSNFSSGSVIAVGTNPFSFGNFISPGTGCPGTPTTFTITVNSAPSITASTPTGTINACAGTASESPNIEQFTVSGSKLTGDITATAPAGFEVSLNATSGFGNTATITQSGGTVTGVVVYVRSAASASGSISGNVALTSPGATAQNVAVSGNVSPPLTITPVPNQTVNAGATTTAVIFQGPASTYNWTNSTPAIGLPASGTGNILAFTAINNTGAPIIAIITVTPVNSFLNCTGLPVTFTITVNPAVVQSGITAGSASGFILACEGTPSASPHIQQVQVSGASLTGNITATAPAGFEISAAANGSFGSSLVLTQSGGTLNSTIVYVRSAASAPTGRISGNVTLSSPGTADQTVAVSGFINAIITVDPVPNQTVKAGASTTAINFTGTASAYSWSNNTPGIGLPASGTGNIAAFTAVNTGTTPVTATITATPVQAAYAYVPNYVRNVNVINILTGDLLGNIAAGNSPESVAISQDGRHVYICNLNSDDISVVDGTTNTVTTLISTGSGSQPYYIALSPDGNTLYAACSASGTILAISTATNKVITSINVGINPVCITPSPDGQKLYVTNLNSETINVISTSNYAITKTISLGLAIYATTISPDGSGLYVAVYGTSSQVLVIDTSTGNVIASIPVAMSAQSIVITPDGSKVYVTDSNANTVTVISTATNSIINTISVDNGPFGIAVSPDGSLVCVTNGYGNDISVISTATDKVIRTIHAASALGLGNFVTGSTGCIGPPTTFTITVNPIGPPSFTASTSLQGLTTTYGTPSPSESFTITGANLTGGVLVTPPPGFEVSTDGTNFSPTITVGTAGDLATAKVYIRLAATTPVGTYSGNILLTSPGTPDVNVVMPNSTVTKAMLIITADNQTKPLGAPNPELTVSYKGFVNGDNQGQLTTLPVATTIATTSSAPGQYVITVDGAASPNYDFTYLNGTLTILPSLQSAVIPNAFTPNGDGVNDFWDIPELADFPTCVVSIYTRYGSLVFQSRGYGKPWDGTSKGSPVPMGTYYYIIDPKQDNIKPISGYVAVIR